MSSLNLTTEQQAHLRAATPQLWLNPQYLQDQAIVATPEVDDLYAAEARLQRFAPLLEILFPELQASGGLIESALMDTQQLSTEFAEGSEGRIFLKADHQLPVAGSIKARGGIHEVLCFAEALARQEGLLEAEGDYTTLNSAAAKAVFSRYTVSVGSTGNLGLSIGIMSAALGFRAEVHMSADAKDWKKQRLTDRGVKVIEHAADYGAAVAAGRAAAEADPYGYFVDDERSPHLFMGYAVAALRLESQLQAAGVRVDAEHPLFVYLPAGVGGAPGGIAFGLKMLFGRYVHCFFAEPVQAPCMLLGMAGNAGDEPVSVAEFGLSIDTEADGLAVGTASQWVCDATRNLISGVYTATDESLYRQLFRLKALADTEVEPSAAIGCLGPEILEGDAGRAYLQAHKLENLMGNATHIAWLTGGSFVPEEEYKRYLDKARHITGA